MSTAIPEKVMRDLAEFPEGVVGRLYEAGGRYEELSSEELPDEVAHRLLELRDEADKVLAKHFRADSFEGAIDLVNRVYRGHERVTVMIQATVDAAYQGEPMSALAERLQRHKGAAAKGRLKGGCERPTGGERR